MAKRFHRTLEAFRKAATGTNIEDPSVEKAEDPKKKRALVLAEQKPGRVELGDPINYRSLESTDSMFNDLGERYSLLHKDLMIAAKKNEKDYFLMIEAEREFLNENNLIKREKLRTSYLEQKALFNKTSNETLKISNKMDPIGKDYLDRGKNLNVFPTVRDEMFTTEGNKLKKAYSNFDPDTDVEVLPFYNYSDDETDTTGIAKIDKVRDRIASLGKEDRLHILGHSGSRFGGISNDEIGDMIHGSDVEDCYIGSCGMDEGMGAFSWMDDKNVSYLPEGSWYGVNPYGEDPLDAMFSVGNDTIYNELEPGVHYDTYSDGEKESVRSKKPKKSTRPTLPSDQYNILSPLGNFSGMQQFKHGGDMTEDPPYEDRDYPIGERTMIDNTNYRVPHTEMIPAEDPTYYDPSDTPTLSTEHRTVAQQKQDTKKWNIINKEQKNNKRVNRYKDALMETFIGATQLRAPTAKEYEISHRGSKKERFKIAGESALWGAGELATGRLLGGASKYIKEMNSLRKKGFGPKESNYLIKNRLTGSYYEPPKNQFQKRREFTESKEYKRSQKMREDAESNPFYTNEPLGSERIMQVTHRSPPNANAGTRPISTGGPSRDMLSPAAVANKQDDVIGLKNVDSPSEVFRNPNTQYKSNEGYSYLNKDEVINIAGPNNETTLGFNLYRYPGFDPGKPGGFTNPKYKMNEVDFFTKSSKTQKELMRRKPKSSFTKDDWKAIENDKTGWPLDPKTNELDDAAMERYIATLEDSKAGRYQSGRISRNSLYDIPGETFLDYNNLSDDSYTSLLKMISKEPDRFNVAHTGWSGSNMNQMFSPGASGHPKYRAERLRNINNSLDKFRKSYPDMKFPDARYEASDLDWPSFNIYKKYRRGGRLDDPPVAASDSIRSVMPRDSMSYRHFIEPGRMQSIRRGIWKSRDEVLSNPIEAKTAMLIDPGSGPAINDSIRNKYYDAYAAGNDSIVNHGINEWMNEIEGKDKYLETMDPADKYRGKFAYGGRFPSMGANENFTFDDFFDQYYAGGNMGDPPTPRNDKLSDMKFAQGPGHRFAPSGTPGAYPSPELDYYEEEEYVPERSMIEPLVEEAIKEQENMASTKKGSSSRRSSTSYNKSRARVKTPEEKELDRRLAVEVKEPNEKRLREKYYGAMAGKINSINEKKIASGKKSDNPGLYVTPSLRDKIPMSDSARISTMGDNYSSSEMTGANRNYYKNIEKISNDFYPIGSAYGEEWNKVIGDKRMPEPGVSGGFDRLSEMLSQMSEGDVQEMLEDYDFQDLGYFGVQGVLGKATENTKGYRRGQANADALRAAATFNRKGYDFGRGGRLPYRQMRRGGNVLAGFMDQNAGNIIKTVGGVALTAAGMPQAGIPLALDGAGDMFGNLSDETSTFPSAPISQEKQLYQAPRAMGGPVGKRTDYEGNLHNSPDGSGIKLPGTGVEVEDNETRTAETIHSDRINLTKRIFNRYKGKVPLKKKHMGMSIADIVKSVDKPFEKREGDKWSDEARLATQSPFEDMSTELSEIYDMYDMEMGGDGVYQQAGYGDTINKMFNDPGYAPAAGSMIAGGIEALSPVEKVNYKKANFVPTRVNPISTTAGIGRIGRTFGNYKEQMRRLNPRGMMNNLTSLAAKEAEAIGDYTGQTNQMNASVQNQANITDSRGGNQMNMYNSNLAAKESEANAANRGAKKTAVSAYFANTSTHIGGIEKDRKLAEANERYNDRYFDVLDERNRILEGNSGGAGSSTGVIDPINTFMEQSAQTDFQNDMMLLNDRGLNLPTSGGNARPMNFDINQRPMENEVEDWMMQPLSEQLGEQPIGVEPWMTDSFTPKRRSMGTTFNHLQNKLIQR